MLSAMPKLGVVSVSSCCSSNDYVLSAWLRSGQCPAIDPAGGQ